MFDTLVAFFVNRGGTSIWMVMLIFALVLLAVRLLLYAIFESIPGEETPRTLALVVIFILLAFTLGLAMTRASDQLRAEAEAVEHKAWVAARCPVYRSECGYKDKNKYACERKGAVVGRNQVGDIFVEAYPTC
jgi:hypothetical protein